MKLMLAFIFLLLIIFSGSAISAYTTHTGVVTVVNLHGDIPTRGVCIKMDPAIPSTGWGCVYTSNPLHRELFSLFLASYTGQKSCLIAWDSVDANSHKVIDYAVCS